MAEIETTDAAINQYAGSAIEQLIDMTAPQPRYAETIDRGGFVRPAPDMAMVFSRDLTDHVLRHHELFSSASPMAMGNVRPLIPLNVDPPAHSKYRKILDPLFAPKRMDEQEADITDRVNRFIDAFADRGECNFTEEFAELFPSSVFLGLMGLPESELATMLRLRDGVLHPDKMDPSVMVDLERRRQINEATALEIYSYFEHWLDERRRTPQNDILTHFLTAEIDGDKLSHEEILDICFLFLIAGLDTVSDSLTCFYAFLATHPDHRRQIVDDPAIIPGAVEELLRWESPVHQGIGRTATTDTTLPNGESIAAGTTVVPVLGAANLDPVEFGDPMDVRFDREGNRHIAFGGGVHRCLGSHLARRELRVTLREWHRRIPEYRIKEGHEELVFPPGLRHVKDLTLVWS